MPAKKLTPEHRAKLHALSTVHSEHVLAKSTLRAEIEQAYHDRLHGFELRESQLMNEAKLAGVPKTMIAAAVGTSNWAALEAKYALTASEFIDAAPAERGPQWTIPTDPRDFVHSDWNQNNLARALTLNWVESGDGDQFHPGPFAVQAWWDKRDDIWVLVPPVEGDPFLSVWDSLSFDERWALNVELEDALADKWPAPDFRPDGGLVSAYIERFEGEVR